ncbi:MAG: TrmB family transcriptional regulator [Chloroflexi bacterium]|nr:TrmB family transcriptional regulator [Chloroflexota bacterium]
MTDPLKSLESLGFGGYEAQAYVALLQGEPMNGYELAKASGVPRPNVYAVLQRLEDKGAVLRMETPAGTRYAAVAPGDLVKRLGDKYQGALDSMKTALEGMGVPLEQRYVWNVSGYEGVIEHARSTIEAAAKDMLVGVWPQEARELGRDTAAAESRGVEVTTLCMAGCPGNCGHCVGRLHRRRVSPGNESRWLVLVGDGEEALAAAVAGNGQGSAVRTKNSVLVELSAGYLRHTIAMATVLSDLGPRLEALLSPEARDVLAGLGPRQSKSWLEYVQGMLGPDSGPRKDTSKE